MNRYWIQHDGVYKLMFQPFYEEECVLAFTQSAEDPDTFYYTSELLNVEYDEEYADSVTEVMELFEDMVAEHYRDEISYYETLLDAWEEN